MARSNSMTSAGQCRLAPLIPCIQDASKLYDYCVKIMFKLHLSLPPDTLTGHRERFLTQFKSLKKFYENTSNLQYFKDLIAIPPLPEVTEIEEDLIKAISIYEFKKPINEENERTNINEQTYPQEYVNFNKPKIDFNVVELASTKSDPETADLLGLWDD